MKNAPLGKSILLADDDANLLNILGSTFEKEGFEVMKAENGQEAWDTLQKGKIPDIVFTGIIMPHMTGFELIQKMRADTKLASIPIAIFSHRGREEDKAKAKELGVNEFIVQGLTPLTEVIRRIKLLVGIHTAFKISVKRNDFDSEVLINFLDREQETAIGWKKDKKTFLEITPSPGKNSYHLKLFSE